MNITKVFILIFMLTTGFGGQSFAQVDSPSSKKHFEAFPVELSATFRMASKIDWTQESAENKRALSYRSAIEDRVAKFRASGDGGIIANKFLVITIDCGTEPKAIALYDLQTGIPGVLEKTVVHDVSYETSSRLLVVDPPEVIQKMYGADVPAGIKTTYFTISDSGKATGVQQ